VTGEFAHKVGAKVFFHLFVDTSRTWTPIFRTVFFLLLSSVQGRYQHEHHLATWNAALVWVAIDDHLNAPCERVNVGTYIARAHFTLWDAIYSDYD